MNNFKIYIISLARIGAFLLVYALGLVLCIWALRYYETGLGAVGNRWQIFLLGGILSGIGCTGAIVSTLGKSLASLKWLLFTLLPGFGLLNILSAPSELEYYSYKISAKPEATLSALSIDSPNKTIRNGRHAYYVIRDVFRGAHFIIEKNSPIPSSVLLSTAGATSVETVNIIENLADLQRAASRVEPTHKLVLSSGQNVWIFSGESGTVNIIASSDNDTLWYLIPSENDEKL